MKEIKGDMWKYFSDDEKYKRYVICITTNGFVKNNGKAVMGRGCAAEAAKRMPDLPERLGQLIKEKGNRVILQPLGCDDAFPECRILTFPVKHNWWEEGDLSLIKKSVKQLKEIAGKSKEFNFILPRPGCGNGHLDWKDVKPLLKDLPENVWVIHK